MIPVHYYLILSLILFAIGLSGLLFLRNGIRILLCIELMLNSVYLILIAYSNKYNSNQAQVFVLFMILVAAAEVAIGLAILILAFRYKKSIDIDLWNKLKW